MKKNLKPLKTIIQYDTVSLSDKRIDSLILNTQLEPSLIEPFLEDKTISQTRRDIIRWESVGTVNSNDQSLKKSFISSHSKRINLTFSNNVLAIEYGALTEIITEKSLYDSITFNELSSNQIYLVLLSKEIIKQTKRLPKRLQENKSISKTENTLQLKDNQKTEKEIKTITRVIELTDSNTIHWILRKDTPSRVSYTSDKYGFGIKKSNNRVFIYLNNIEEPFMRSSVERRVISNGKTEKAKCLRRLLQSIERQTKQFIFTGSNETSVIPHIVTNNKKDISKSDFIVYYYGLACRKKGHVLENVLGNIEITNANGEQEHAQVQSVYCKKCGVYYLTKKDYDKLISRGIPSCRIVSRDLFYKYGKGYFKRKDVSDFVLSDYGYNVQKNNNMNQHERHIRLKAIVNYDILTISEIKGKISFFIKQKEGMVNYASAVEKWQNDYSFLERLEYEMKNIKIGTIKVTNYYPKL